MSVAGTVCQTKERVKDGLSIEICASVNSHNFLRKNEGLLTYSGIGFGNILYVDYIILKQNGIAVARADPDQGYTPFPADSTLSSGWFDLPANCVGKTFQCTVRYKIHWGNTPAGTWTTFYTVSSNIVPTQWC